MEPQAPFIVLTDSTRPIELLCFHCKHRGYTEISRSNGQCVVLTAYFLCVYIFTIPLMPIALIPPFKDYVHKCSTCKQILAFRRACT
mmetsp:Transcript_36593/g.35387  ORF Transcript_36593/g.35387 Transcript_36593/m.35387 type:complete len:87 (-) Transcript_36593:40-300(-)